MFSAPLTCWSSSMRSGTDRRAQAAALDRPGQVVPPAGIGAGVGDLDHLAGAGGVQAGTVVAFVLALVEVDGQLARARHQGGLVPDEQGDRGLGPAGHHGLGEVGHRLQQAVHRQLTQGQPTQALQRLGGVRGLRVLVADHGTASGPLCTGGGSPRLRDPDLEPALAHCAAAGRTINAGPSQRLCPR